MSDSIKASVKRDEREWEVEVKAEISPEQLATYREEALKEIQKTAKLDGFRPGKAPLDRILQVYGEAAVMHDAAERAIQSELPEILAKEQFLIVETPRVSAGEPVSGQPLPFTARAGLAPEVKLGDYQSIAKKQNGKKEAVSVSEDEHKQATMHLRRERARIEQFEKGEEPAKAAEIAQKMEEKDLPLLDDAFVQSLGYENAAKFEEMLRDNMKKEKESQAQQKMRSAILDDIVQASTIHYPAAMRRYELDDMETRFKEDIARAGMQFDAYLAEVKKTPEQLRESWHDAADKRAKVRLILNEIAKAEKIEAKETDVAAELEHAKEHYKNIDPEQLRAGITHALRNEAVMQFLEQIK